MWWELERPLLSWTITIPPRDFAAVEHEEFPTGERAQVTLHFYAIRCEEHRLVAAEIDPPAAAALLAAAHPLLLGTAEDLAKVAQRLNRPLVTIARAEPCRSAAAARTAQEALRPPARTAAPEPVAVIPQAEARGLFGIRWLAGRSARSDGRSGRVAFTPNPASPCDSSSASAGLEHLCPRPNVRG